MKISVGISTNSEAEVSVDLRGFCKKIEAKHILHIAIIFLIEKKIVGINRSKSCSDFYLKKKIRAISPAEKKIQKRTFFLIDIVNSRNHTLPPQKNYYYYYNGLYQQSFGLDNFFGLFPSGEIGSHWRYCQEPSERFDPIGRGIKSSDKKIWEIES